MVLWKNKKVILVLLIANIFNINAQDVYYLGSRDCVIASFCLLNEHHCSSITNYDIFKSLPYTQNIYHCQIDSILMIHADGGYIDASWFNKVRFILIDDTLLLHSDTTYIGSLDVEFDMDYVVLTATINKSTNIVNEMDGHPRPAGFLCDCDMQDKKTFVICENYKKMIADKLNECRRTLRHD